MNDTQALKNLITSAESESEKLNNTIHEIHKKNLENLNQVLENTINKKLENLSNRIHSTIKAEMSYSKKLIISVTIAMTLIMTALGIYLLAPIEWIIPESNRVTIDNQDYLIINKNEALTSEDDNQHYYIKVD